jgi:hypothetical protein
MRFGYLEDRDRARQAAAFVCVYRKNPSGDWRESFTRWAGPDGKDFHPGDLHAVEMIVEELFLADGTLTFTDAA